ncbi:hypothetical protein WICMUC_000143 [Wickerhamomyces mucosus]|uniref:F-box domain-containing protein n=1 Tax=Wickerhamomyces mucosus TaxID=1378264 RepID=A0A9P8PYC2_9ASCO|nr:hypothetical protein WICMUC_000143 [Wickerhamomyces mucosus]
MKRNNNGLDSKRKKPKNELNLQNLPEEILINIISNLSQSDTYNLISLSKSFLKPCRLRLYSKIIICEKYQDTFYYQLTRKQKSTILSSFLNILKFFRFIYTNILNNNDENIKNLQYLGIVENLSSFNYLDCGELDIHRYLTKNDLKNVLELRQYWDIVINQFKGLKYWNFPKLSIEKLNYLNSNIKNQLKHISLSLKFENDYDNFDNNVNFYNLESLVLNFDGVEAIPLECLKFLKIILQNNNLKSLELNGKFGIFDRNLEHYLRHYDFNNDINVKSSFMKGFEIGELMFKHRFSIDEIRRTYDDKGLPEVDRDHREDEEEEEEEEDDEEEEEELDETAIGTTVDNTTQGDDIDVDLLSPILNNIKFGKDCYFLGYSPSFTNDAENLADLLNYFKEWRINFAKLEKLSIKNFDFNSIIINNDNISNDYWVINNFLKELFESGNLKEFQSINNFNTNGILKENQSSFDKLIIIEENSSNKFEELQNIGSIKYLKYYQLHVDKFKINRKSNNWEIIELFEFLKLNQPNLEILNFCKPAEILIVIRKILNLKIFKTFQKFNNFNKIDDYFFENYKKLIEIFNQVLRIEDYGSINDEIIGIEEFKQEFEYLFNDEVQQIWKICKKLKKFYYFGHCFERPLNV